MDGNITRNVASQTAALPHGATHLIISVECNDALQKTDIFSEPASTVGEGLFRLSGILDDFRQNYRQMLQHVLGFKLPVAACTIYNSVPGLGGMATTALALFNEIILQEAFIAKVPVIDLPLICNEDSDYSLIAPSNPHTTGA